MPATGLPDVKQKAIFDASEYVRGSDETVIAAIKMAQANRDVVKTFDDVNRMAITTAAALAGSEASFSRFIAANRDISAMSASVQQYTEKVRGLANGYEMLAAASEATARNQQDAARIAVASIGIQKQAQQEYYETVARVAQASRNIQVTALGEVAAAHVELQKQITATGDALEAGISAKKPGFESTALRMQEKLSGLSTSFRKIEEDVIRISESPRVAAAISALSPKGGFGAYGGGDSRGSRETFEQLLPNIARGMRAEEDSRRFQSVIPSLLAGGGMAAIMSMLETPSIRSAIGSAARGAGNAAATVAGTAGAAIYNTVGGGAGSFDMGRAAIESAAVGGFIKRWYPVAHWAMMLSNELLATVGPAAVAAGMGGLVGMQGGEQVIPRMKAIFSTAESLGGSLGITAGQAAGLKNSPLQTAQDLATGGAFELTGAGINMMRAGAGNAFIQLGSNTVAMFSRFAATMTQEFQHGLGKQLGDIVSGGTGYLQQLGDVLGNIGHVFLNVAPNLPGVGGDLLGTLQGATGGLAAITKWLGPALGPVLSFEAGARWGPALVGGTARLLGKAPAGLLGSVARTATAEDVAAGLATKEGETIAGRGVAGALGSLGAADIGAVAAGAFLLTKSATYQTKAQQDAAATMQGINQMGFAQGVPSILSAMQAAAAVPRGTAGAEDPFWMNVHGIGGILGGIGRAKPSEIYKGFTQATAGAIDFFTGGTGTPSNFSVAQQQLQNLSNTMVNALGSGQQVATEWKKVSGSTVDMGKAFDIATMAQLQLGSSFEKNGKLTAQAKQMIDNLQAGYQAMNFTGIHGSAMFGSAVGAQTAMAGLQHSQIGAVNQAYDQLLQLATGGTSGAAGFFGTLGGAPVTHKVGGINFSAPPAFAKFAQALTSFTTPSGAAAWNTFTNPQSGLVSQLGGQFDWLRSMQTMGALSPGQTTGMAGFYLQQLLPMARKSPAALAQLSTLAQEFGGPVYGKGESQQQAFSAMSQWIKSFGDTAKQFNTDMNSGTKAVSSIPRDAQQFSQQIGSNIAGDLASGITRHGADLQNKFMDSIIGSGGKNMDMSALRNYVNFLANAGVPKAAGLDMTKRVAQIGGGGQNAQIQNSINAMISGAYARVKVQADVSQAKTAIASLGHATMNPKITVKAEVGAAQAAINAIKGKDIPVAVKAQGIGAVQAAIDSIHGKTVTITTINRLITQVIGMGTPAGGVAPATLAGGPANMRITSGGNTAGGGVILRGQTGMFIPGYGGGDIHPAMLEAGELVVPKHLVPSVAPILGGKIPGFAGGGGFGVMGFETLLQQAFHGEGVQDTMMQVIDGIFRSEIQKFPQVSQFSPRNAGGPTAGTPHFIPSGGGNTRIGPSFPVGSLRGADATVFKSGGKEISIEILKGISEGMKNSGPEARKLASAMVNKIQAEMKYATGVANAAAYGQGYDPTGKGSGIFGGMNLTSPSGLTAAQQHPAGPNSPGFNAKDYNAYVAAYAAGDPTQQAQSVQDQMKSYLKTEQSFGKDIGKLRKEHLNKAVLAQLIAAGPQQGDALAQSILGGQGGVGSVNKLWQQIQKASKGLGAQAAMGQYGGTVAPNLKSGTFVNNNVSISVSVGGGGGGGGLGDLSTKQLNQLVSRIQAALLKQAKRNRKTGVALKGKQA